jgi:hypothetical protein
MIEFSWLPLAGGALIGAAASLLLLTHGRGCRDDRWSLPRPSSAAA